MRLPEIPVNAGSNLSKYSHPLTVATVSILLALGTYLRAKEFLFARSLWADEAKIAVLILGLDYFDLLKPLGDNQAAPPGFLWLTKFVAHLGGNSERALRLPGFLVSLALLPLTYDAGWRLLGRCAAVLMLIPVALSSHLIEYASEVKQYAFDAFATVVVLHATVCYLTIANRRWPLVWLAVAGCVTLLFSHAVVFVTAGCGAALLVHELQNRNMAALKRLGFAGGIVLMAGLANFFFFLRPLLLNQDLIVHHAPSFPSMPPNTLGELTVLGKYLLKPFHHPVGFHRTLPAALCLILGLVLPALRKRISHAMIVGLPLVLLLLAVGADKYSYLNRLILFTVPVLSLGMAMGIAGLFETRNPMAVFLGIGLLITVYGDFTHNLWTDSGYWKPRTMEEIRPVMEYVAEHKQPEDRFFLYYGAGLPFHYYNTWGSLRGQFDGHEIQGVEGLPPLPDIVPVSMRIWFIRAHVPGHRQEDARQLQNELERRGTRLDHRVEKGATGTLYAFEAGE